MGPARGQGGVTVHYASLCTPARPRRGVCQGMTRCVSDGESWFLREVTIQDALGKTVRKLNGFGPGILQDETAKDRLTQQKIVFLHREARHAAHLPGTDGWQGKPHADE